MRKTTLQNIKKSLSAVTIATFMLAPTGLALATFAPAAFADTAPTTSAATSISSSDATFNGTNGDTAADNSSFWVSTSTFATPPDGSPFPAGVYSTPVLGAQAADAPFSAQLSSATGMPAVTSDTTYYYAAWTEVDGTWSPGAVESFTTVSAPTITNISPSSGSTSGGTAITITGTDFNAGATVTVGGAPATSVVVVDNTSITATTPAGSAGAQDVVVNNTDGGTATATGGFTYVADVATAPTTLPATAITSSDATLNGMNGSADAIDSSFWVSTSTFSTAIPTPPAGVSSTPLLGPVAANTAFSASLSTVAGMLPITPSTTYFVAAWTNVGGTWSPGAVLQFTTSAAVPTAPVVTSLSTTTGPTAGGTSLTITGTGFTGATAVDFGSTAATGVVVNSDTSITAISPATTTPGVADVTVTTPEGTSAISDADQFTYQLSGTVTGAGVLHVDSIDLTKTNATADGTYANGWVYTFNITVPTDETNLSMEFSNWLSGSNTIPVGGNMQISSAQANNSGAEVPLTAANTFSTPALVMTGDLAPETPGLQVQVVVDVAVPVGTPDGSYSTNYAVQTQP